VILLTAGKIALLAIYFKSLILFREFLYLSPGFSGLGVEIHVEFQPEGRSFISF